MQPLVESIRSQLTATQVRYLIEGSPGIKVGFGLEATDLAQVEVADISADCAGGTIDRSMYATLHGTCQIALSARLDWGWAVIRPYMTLTEGTLTGRFNLGAYFTNTPSRPTKEQPPTWSVTGYDLLYGLDTKVGDTYAIDIGVAILGRVEEILLANGYTRYVIDQASAGVVSSTSRVWAMAENATWLNVVNDLLGMIGYQGIWSDWNGYLRCQRYQRPVERAYEWYLPANAYTSILGDDAEVEFDFHDAPNRWVGVQSNVSDGPAPVEGAGVYTYINESTGPTSVLARRGLLRTRREDFDVTSHLALIARVEQMVDADVSVPTRIKATTGPLPLAWHFDRYLVDDPDIGAPSEVMGTSWTLPLNGDDMTHSWSVLSGVQS